MFSKYTHAVRDGDGYNRDNWRLAIMLGVRKKPVPKAEQARKVKLGRKALSCELVVGKF